MALASLGLRQGDEVIIPSFTWIATANAVELCGARPVFCDVDPETFNIDVTQLESHITPRTRAIVPVHLFGLPADLEPLQQIADQHQLALVEDAACALGSRYRGRHVGTFGDVGTFSFFFSHHCSCLIHFLFHHTSFKGFGNDSKESIFLKRFGHEIKGAFFHRIYGIDNKI